MVVYYIRKESRYVDDKFDRYSVLSADKLPYTKVGPNTFVVEPMPELTFIAYTESEEMARKIVAMLVDEQKSDTRNGHTWDAISEFEIK